MLSPSRGQGMGDDPSALADEGRRATLFLSYARADRPLADRLAAALEQAGFDIWWDALIEGGSAFTKKIGEALARADAVLVLWSRTSIESDWVCDEAATGRDRGRLVPLSIDDAHPPLGFRQYQAIKLDRWHGRVDAPEIAAIKRGVATVCGAAPRHAAPPPRVSRRRAIAVAAVGGAAVVGGGIAWTARHALIGGGARPDSIAVLPFRNLSSDPAQAYFAEGLTEEVRAALRRLGSLQVSAATSSEAASAGGGDVPAIARRLGVAYLLEGSVQRAGAILRIAVDLTDGATGFSRWSNAVDRPLADVFAIQNEIAGLVARAMSARIATATPPPGGTHDVDAYEHFLRGRSLFNLGKDEPTDRSALAELDQAIALDPRFALAHAARSRVLAAIAGEYAQATELPALYGEAIAAAQKAIALAPELAEAQLAMGFALFTGRLQVRQARPFYDRAFALAHGNADIILLVALYWSRVGRAREAAAAIAQAVTLDPLNARTHRAAGSVAFAAHDFRGALPPLRRAVQLNPSLGNSHVLIGYSLMLLGDLPAATREIAAEPRETFRYAGLAIAHHRAGHEADARRAFAALLAGSGESALYQQAEVRAQWGDAPAALAALAQARTVGDSGLVYVATDPLLDPLRREPAFVRFVKDMGFD